MRSRLVAIGRVGHRIVAPVRLLLARGVLAWSRYAAPRLAVITPLGWGGLLALIGATVLGWRWGWTELRVLAIFLALLLASAAIWTLGRMSYAAVIDLPRNRVTVGSTAVGRIVVRSREGRSTGSKFEFPVGRAVPVFAVPALGADDEHEQLFSIPTRRRGVIVLGPIRSVKGDPLGLVQRVKQWSEPVELFVHPKWVPLDAASTGFLRDIDGVATTNLSSSDVAFHALRDYVPGDDRRSVHWRTTARTGKLMVRQFEETQRSHLLVVLSRRVADYRNADEFELAISCVASVAAQALRENRRVSVYAHGGAIRFVGATSLLDQLAGVDALPNGAEFGELAALAIAEAPQTSVACLVTGSRTEPAQLRAAEIRIPVEIRSFLLRCADGATTARRRLAGLTVLDVPTLEDLPRAVRAVR